MAFSNSFSDDRLDDIAQTWEQSDEADDLEPLPRGWYEVDVISGQLHTSRSDTPGYKVVMQVREGEFAGRRIWWDHWLTPAAIPMSKRDLKVLGITSLEQMKQPLPAGMICKVRLVLHTDDDGEQRNRVRKVELLRIEEPVADDFAPAEEDED